MHGFFVKTRKIKKYYHHKLSAELIYSGGLRDYFNIFHRTHRPPGNIQFQV